MAWLLLAAAIGIEVVATLLLKLSMSGGLNAWRWLFAVVPGYVTAFGLLAAALRLGMPLGVAYGTWAASGVGLVALASARFFAEALTGRMVTGIGLIAIGVVLIETGSSH